MLYSKLLLPSMCVDKSVAFSMNCSSFKSAVPRNIMAAVNEAMSLLPSGSAVLPAPLNTTA